LKELSGFSFQDSFLSLLKRHYGNTTLKERFLDVNRMYLDSEDTAQLNEETIKYKRQMYEGTVALIGICTFGSLIYGICVLPARRSPVKYTVGGFGVGVLLSYGLWRLQLHQYEKKVNQLFRKIVKDQYNESKELKL
jgi:hypothetical protein